uniref:Endolytic murein transglycosylase n=1 Tax=Hydromonas duriensis TaxID=1527608 RepID=A0A4R6Y8Y2_9BURK|nr:endolytic transglycosylase MltG [Hydromonas duriensis]TDR31882.1 UPF0755 protein [Hydromonas duriensis]
MNLLFKYKKVAIFLLSLLLIIFWGATRLASPLGDKGQTQTLTIAKGAGASTVAEQLAKMSRASGGSVTAFEIETLSLLTGRSNDYKMGDYDINPKASLSSILDKIARGEIAPLKIRIAEGATWAQIKSVLLKADMQHDAQELDVKQLATVLKLDTASAEGMIFPDTYQYRRGEAETAVLSRAAQILHSRLNAAWDKRAEGLPYKTPYEALTMASIIEKETGAAEDRAMVAAVFVNRLKVPMRLQTDPTVIYGIGADFNGNLTKADLQTDTPFNTYTQDGLPPTPIATASMASIEAALHPADSKVLYFVARGDGSSEFSETLSEHNAAVKKYQLNPVKKSAQ